MRLLPLLICGVLLAGCADLEIKPGQGAKARRDTPPGPGLLTGKQGEFVIYRLEDEPAQSDEEDEAEKPSD